MQVLMLQHGVLLLVLSSEVPDDLVFGRAPSFCVHDLVVATHFWVPDQRTQYPEVSSPQLQSLNLKRMKSSSLQNHPVSTQKCEVTSSNCSFGAEPVGEARAAKEPNMLLKRECADSS